MKTKNGVQSEYHRRTEGVVSGHRARAGRLTMISHQVGALPLLTRVMERMDLEGSLREYVDSDDSRIKLSASCVLTLLVANILVAREPVYGVGDWARNYAPDLFNLWPDELTHLNDDRVGRSLDRLFDALDSDLVLSVVRQVVQEFEVSLDELHNDSTTVSFYGAYDGQNEVASLRGQLLPGITHGHSKDHRPDLKQLLYILTVSNDGGVPVYFQTESGNMTDDKTHQATWQILKDLVGRPDFVYVADCKLATSENMNAIARWGGRFITILPATRKENQQFRDRLRHTPHEVKWNELYRVVDEDEALLDVYSACSDEFVSAEGFRLLWIHSQAKQVRDAAARAKSADRAIQELTALRNRLAGPKTRLKTREQVEEVIQKILNEHGVQEWLTVDIQQNEEESFRREGRGRPSKESKYVRVVRTHFSISWCVDTARWELAALDDGVFPIITNIRDWEPRELLKAYKRQPIVEKRFSNFKTDYCVAPVYLKSRSRIVALLAVYFFALMAQTLLERELRRAMKRERLASLPMYPEDRDCARPTTRSVIDLFANVQRHTLRPGTDHEECLVTDLSELQIAIATFLGVDPMQYAN